MSHEVTVTFQHKGKWVVAPSVIDGKSHSEDEVAQKVRAGDLKPFATFETLKEADAYAEKRSKSADEPKSVLGRTK